MGVLNKYCSDFPERIPPEDCGRPVLPILVEFFCGQIWERLLASAAGVEHVDHIEGNKIHNIFQLVDADHNGQIDAGELTQAIQSRLGSQLSSKVIVEQIISIVDGDADGKITEAE